MTTPKDFGKIFQDAREKKGLTVDQVNIKSKIHHNVIRDLENGVCDRLDKLYVKSFIKKYSEFLGLNVDEMLSKYHEIYVSGSVGTFSKRSSHEEKQAPVKETKFFEMEQISAKDDIVIQQIKKTKEKYVKKPESRGVDFAKANGKKLLVMAAIALGAVILIAALVFGVKAGSAFIKDMQIKKDLAAKEALLSAPQEAQIKKSKKDKDAAKKAQAESIKKQTASQKDAAKFLENIKTAEKKPQEVKTVAQPAKIEKKAAPGPDAISITFTARGDVWVQVFYNGRTIFAETMAAGSSKTLDVDGPVTVWTGKGEFLEFAINGQEIGKVVDGVVRNIVVSKEGIKLADKWLKRLE